MWVPETLVGVSGNSGRFIVRELGVVNVEIEVLGAVRRAIEEHRSIALENAVDDGLGQVGVMQHGAPGDWSCLAFVDT